MPRFLFIGSSVDGNEHGLPVLHLQFIFIRQTALELSELGVKRGLGCKVQREQGRKGIRIHPAGTDGIVEYVRQAVLCVTEI